MSASIKRVLITGASGAVGSSLLNSSFLDDKSFLQDSSFLQNSEVFALYRSSVPSQVLSSKIRCIQADLLASPLQLDLPEEVDVVIHCAGVVPAKAESDASFSNNVKLAAAVHEIYRRTKARYLLMLSTGSVYATDAVPKCESNPQFSEHPYAKSQLAAERLLQEKVESLGIFRIFYPYGFSPQLNENYLFTRLLKQIDNNEILRVAAEPSAPLIQPLFINDLAKVLEVFLTTTTVGTYNLAGAEAVSLVEVLTRVAALRGKEVQIERDEKLLPPLLANLSKLHEVVPASAFTSFWEGLSQMLSLWPAPQN